MSESDDRKTEEPTRRKLRQAREDGDVPFSRDVSNTVALIAVFAALWIGADVITGRLLQLGRYALETPIRILSSGGDRTALDGAFEIFQIVAVLIFPLTIIAALAAIAINIWQTKGMFSVRAIRLQPNRINPAEGFKQIFSRRNGIELLKSIVKICLLGLALYLVIRWSLNTMVKLPSLAIDSILTVSAILFATFFGTAAIILGIIAAFDIWFQQFEYLRRNRMTPEEVKRERKDDTGDPHMRAARRKLALQSTGESLLERTAKASLIVYSAADNIAIALAFTDGNPAEPWLINKGATHVASAIREIGQEAQVQVVENSRLAGDINRNVQINDDIPDIYLQDIQKLIS